MLETDPAMLPLPATILIQKNSQPLAANLRDPPHPKAVISFVGDDPETEGFSWTGHQWTLLRSFVAD
jgi:hypothetical protein